jgi:hypothetical protein
MTTSTPEYISTNDDREVSVESDDDYTYGGQSAFHISPERTRSKQQRWDDDNGNETDDDEPQHPSVNFIQNMRITELSDNVIKQFTEGIDFNVHIKDGISLKSQCPFNEFDLPVTRGQTVIDPERLALNEKARLHEVYMINQAIWNRRVNALNAKNDPGGPK